MGRIGNILNAVSGVLQNLGELTGDYRGDQYCPDCGIACIHYDGYWECPECRYSITDEEVAEGDGYSGDGDYYAASYDGVDDIPEGCFACGGDYPNCRDSCPLFD